MTVLFCDVSGSTALGERIDPESLRHVMARYFETAKAVVERHGGTVEKFIGDAVMAVFGIPAVHEDDALRAIRAAQDLREALGALNTQLEASYGTVLELRMGVNTGEVVTGTEERLATGDAVNVAARLEQAAPPGEILLGAETLGLVRDAVDVELVQPLELKGKADPVEAFRLVEVRSGSEAVARRHAAAMVGRERQRQLLEDAFANVVSERACHLFTLLGTAGVGKSRLVAEFLSGLDGATVVRGRCLSYGEGITYWPVTEVVKQLDAASQTAALSAILGDEDAVSSPEQIAWAFRKLLEARARERPLVVVFDDIHWGEPTFLDLVEHVADLSRDAPILLLCLARPELLDQRPAWGGGKLNATNVLLEPLGVEEAGELIERLLPGNGIGEALRGRILETAGGNPLFVEEMVAMVAELRPGRTVGDVAVPPTIQALLAARLDQLDPAERGVLERGSVEGQVFHRGAVAALAPDAPVDGQLLTLVRKDLVRPDRPTLADDDAYRFRHLLIRDTAYEALPKATRAALHERFARWLEQRATDLVELDEIVGYHFEQAYGYRVELGPVDEAAQALAAAAAERLFAGAERARTRGDLVAARTLLGRVRMLAPEDAGVHRRATLSLGIAVVGEGDFARARKLFDEVDAAASAAGDERLRLYAELAQIELLIQTDPQVGMEDARVRAEKAAEALERLGDDEGLAWALRLVGNFRSWLGQAGAAERIWTRALELAERSGSQMNVAEIVTWTLWSAWYGPISAVDGIRRCDDAIERVFGNPLVEATARLMRGALQAIRGEAEQARADIAAGRQLFTELGNPMWWAGTSMVEGDAELCLGDPARAEAVLREGHERLIQSAETGYLATVVGMRAQAALELDRYDEALALADETERLASPDDFEPHARLGCVRASILARRGELEQAEKVLAAAEATAERTEYLPLRMLAALTRAEAEHLAGRPEGERAALEEALRLAELKGDLVRAEATRARLTAL